MRHIESLIIAFIGAGNVSIRDVKLPHFNFDYIAGSWKRAKFIDGNGISLLFILYFFFIHVEVKNINQNTFIQWY